MGPPCCVLLVPVSCLILVQVVGSGSMKVLREPTCFSDYANLSTCEWQMNGPINCSAELRLSYQLDFLLSEILTCVPENSEGAGCVCHMPMDGMVATDNYKVALLARQQLLWTGSFKPSEYVKPRAPENLTVHTNVSDTLLLTWSNPYPRDSFLYDELTYLVNISSEDNPTDVRIYNVTYLEPTLRLAASTMKSGVSYGVRVKAWAQRYNSTWSEWSPSITWRHSYRDPLEQRLPLGVSISCIVILAICLSCYFGIIKIKKEWWDQIPNAAHSPLMAIVIQDSQVSLWERRSQGQELAKCPRWKTCLTKLLPCLLEHGMKRNEDPPKAARSGPFQGPSKSVWHPVEVSKTVLWPEIISVERCVELFEAQAEGEQEEAEEDDFCPWPESSKGGFQEGREGIAARLTESLFLDLLGGEEGGLGQQGLGESCLLPPSGSTSAQMSQAEFPNTGPPGEASQGAELPFGQEPGPAASPTQSLASLACTETPVVIADNPAYRSLSNSLSQPPSPGELAPDPQLAERLEEVDPTGPCAPEPSEPETWEQILRQSVLQHQAAPTSAPASGYREFVHAVQQGSPQDGAGAGLGPSGEAGYKAFSSLLTSSTVSPGACGLGASSGEGGYKPFQDLLPGCPGDPAPGPVPLFTFGLDTEPCHGPQNSHFLGGSPELLGLEPGGEGEGRQKPPLSPQQATDPPSDDLGSGIVYSALTCHLCGHLKQCHGQEESGQAHVVAGPCCGCCCGDRPSPLMTPLSTPDPSLGGIPLEASLCPASLAPLGISEEGKSSPPFQPAPGNAQSSSQTSKMMSPVSLGLACTRAS
ncbi:interleukin-4 receptor subunit alpha [Carlito syrichta]|uniref:Interleukin-4 receptor subunit alpha n=1 Tax=Carlito syrichta TaxID=1868482 RepID=A0A1U7TYT4_CARSF|nr:interleukin-4 receptor subunit alpha [Carlito syrichta]